MDLDRFRQLPLMGILRGGDLSVVEPLVETLVDAGLETLEITMNTVGASEMIRAANNVSGGRLMIGAGTVLSAGDVKRASNAGAGFIVSPVLVEEVANECSTRQLPSFPGALTPSEVFKAWQAGAAMVKVFPASAFGPGYLRELKGPFDDVSLLACGGVNADNASEFLAAGASALAFGGSIFSPRRLEERDFGAIAADVSALVDSTKRAGHA